MSDVSWQIIRTAKAQQWEVAKGHLRAIAMIDGSSPSGGKSNWEAIQKAVEDFIRDFEENGHNE